MNGIHFRQTHISNKSQTDKAGQASPAFRQIGESGSRERMIEMDITGIAKSHHKKSTATGKPSSKKEWKLSDSLREKITKYAKEDAAQNIYMGNKFLAL